MDHSLPLDITVVTYAVLLLLECPGGLTTTLSNAEGSGAGVVAALSSKLSRMSILQVDIISTKQVKSSDEKWKNCVLGVLLYLGSSDVQRTVQSETSSCDMTRDSGTGSDCKPGSGCLVIGRLVVVATSMSDM